MVACYLLGAMVLAIPLLLGWEDWIGLLVRSVAFAAILIWWRQFVAFSVSFNLIHASKQSMVLATRWHVLIIVLVLEVCVIGELPRILGNL